MSGQGRRPLVRKHVELKELLQLASPDELREIAGILLDEENDRFLADDRARQNIAVHYEAGTLYRAVDSIAYEICALGSNGIASFLRRGEPVSYDEIVRDVASELKVNFSKDHRTADIDQRLLDTLMQQAEQDESIRGVNPGSIFMPNVAAKQKILIGSALAAAVLPVSALAVYGAYFVMVGNKARPELQGLTKIVVHVARIRQDIIAADHEDFIDRLRACL